MTYTKIRAASLVALAAAYAAAGPLTGRALSVSPPVDAVNLATDAAVEALTLRTEAASPQKKVGVDMPWTLEAVNAVRDDPTATQWYPYGKFEMGGSSYLKFEMDDVPGGRQFVSCKVDDLDATRPRPTIVFMAKRGAGMGASVLHVGNLTDRPGFHFSLGPVSDGTLKAAGMKARITFRVPDTLAWTASECDVGWLAPASPPPVANAALIARAQVALRQSTGDATATVKETKIHFGLSARRLTATAPTTLGTVIMNPVSLQARSDLSPAQAQITLPVTRGNVVSWYRGLKGFRLYHECDVVAPLTLPTGSVFRLRADANMDPTLGASTKVPATYNTKTRRWYFVTPAATADEGTWVGLHGFDSQVPQDAQYTLKSCTVLPFRA